MNHFTEPTNRVSMGIFSMASCADEAMHTTVSLEDLPFEGIVPWFTNYAHPNLPVALSALMQMHGVKVVCSIPVTDDSHAYWQTGRIDGDDYGRFADVSS